MADRAHIGIVLEDDPKLIERLVAEMPVWASRFPSSEGLADRLRKDPSHDASRFTVLNSFDATGDVEDQLLDLIHDVDLHHGAAGGHPPLGRLEVYGASLTAEVTKNLEQFGLTSVEETSGGFTAKAQV